MRRFLLAATLFSLIGMTPAVADDPLVQVVQPAQPKVIQPVQSPVQITSTPILSQLEEDVKTLEDQRHTKKTHLKEAEIRVVIAEKNLERLDRIDRSRGVSKEDMEKAKIEVEATKAQVEIRSGELKEIEVKIKHARKRLEEAKAVADQKPTNEELKAGVVAMAAGWFGGTPLRGGAALPQPLGTPATLASKIAVFNMAAVMKDYGKAKYQVYQLNEERKRLSADLVPLRAECTKLQNDITIEQNPTMKEQLEQRKVELTRQIEDKSKRIDKQMTNKASALISSLYDEIKLVVDETAKTKGYAIVFAYPDASNPEDLMSPHVKELKLKPPAAQPFYVAKKVDLTDEVIETLNARYPVPPIPNAP
ncbi:MAG TPA: OmpH family outer membrane protein [Gemmata sp.]|jgi:Skp family chaperone for outer membrane proteins|nr:OmpH family outer membrane protein [Gemmata sp.]